jgi:hypothetical protein
VKHDHVGKKEENSQFITHACVVALFAWLISHQTAVLFSHSKSVTSNQPAVLFSQNKPAPAISHQPTEQAGPDKSRYCRAGTEGQNG